MSTATSPMSMGCRLQVIWMCSHVTSKLQNMVTFKPHTLKYDGDVSLPCNTFRKHAQEQGLAGLVYIVPNEALTMYGEHFPSPFMQRMKEMFHLVPTKSFLQLVSTCWEHLACQPYCQVNCTILPCICVGYLPEPYSDKLCDIVPNIHLLLMSLSVHQLFNDVGLYSPWV